MSLLAALSVDAAVTAVIPAVSFGLFLYCFHRINRAKPARRVVVAAAATDLEIEPPTPQEVEIVKGANKINVDVDLCPRCKQPHADLEFDRFGGNPIGGFTHYAACPDTKEPILIKIGIVDDTAPATKSVCGGALPKAAPAEDAPPVGGSCGRRP